MSIADAMGFGPKRVTRIVDDHFEIDVTANSAFIKEPKTNTVRLSKDQYRRYLRWRNRELLIQDALPDIARSDLEILMSGLGPEEFAKATREEDNE